MSNSVAAGIILAISASAPATFDASGYSGLSFTDVGEITDIDGFGPTWSTASHNPLAKRGTQKKKTSRNGGTFTATLALDTKDAGQVMVKAARVSATDTPSIRILMPNGDFYCCQVLVTSFQLGALNQAGLQTATITCEVQCSATDVDWVESIAA